MRRRIMIEAESFCLRVVVPVDFYNIADKQVSMEPAIAAATAQGHSD